MTTATKKAASIALALPAKSRAELAETLLGSLDDPRQRELDKLWAEEAESRIAAFEAGKIRAIPAGEVFRNLKTRKQ